MNNKEEIVTLKKPHPCLSKSYDFKVISIDGEVRLKCMGCQGIILLKRNTFEKSVKKKKEIMDYEP